jgi:hypothetical protein
MPKKREYNDNEYPTGWTKAGALAGVIVGGSTVIGVAEKSRVFPYLADELAESTREVFPRSKATGGKVLAGLAGLGVGMLLVDAGISYAMGKHIGSKAAREGSHNVKPYNELNPRLKMATFGKIAYSPIGVLPYRQGVLAGYKSTNERLNKSWDTRKKKYGKKGRR